MPYSDFEDKGQYYADRDEFEREFPEEAEHEQERLFDSEDWDDDFYEDFWF
jgi:hypothetical protein